MAEQKTNEVVIVEGKLRKIVHQQGQGQQPQKGQQVFALYKGTLQDGTQFDSNQDRENPFKFTIGQGMVIKGWDEGFASMKKGEKATLICSPEYAYGARGSPPKIPPNATLHFDVELLDFQDKKKQKWDMSSQEKVIEAEKAKAQGNQHLKNNQLAQAIKSYQQGIDFVDFQEQPEAKKILKLLQLNISQAYLKNSQYAKCIENAAKVLKDEPLNAKALYRRGLAYSKTQQFENAQNDFQELLKVDPENIQAKKQILNIANSIKKFKAKQKKVYSGMFAQSLYDDKKIEPPKPKVQDDDQADPNFDGQPISSNPSDEQKQPVQKEKAMEVQNESKAQQQAKNQ